MAKEKAEVEAETVKLKPVNDSPLPSSPRQADADDDYDPHQHRVVEKPTSNGETFVHLLKCCLGTGILAMPQAFARAGILVGIISTLIIGVMLTHCLQILIRSQYVICKRRRVPLLTYPESVTACLEIGPEFLRRFSKPSAPIVDFFLVVYQLGICCVYIVFIAGNVKKMVDPYYVMSIEIHCLIILLPLIAFNLIRDLKMLAPFSTLANILIFIGLGIIIYYLVSGKKTEGKMELTAQIDLYPLYFGTTLFALTAVGVVVALENNMKTPKAFGTPCGVLNVGMGVVVLLYIALGAIGYNYCLHACSDSITLDLPQGVASTINLAMFALAIFISYGLQCYVPVAILWSTYMLPRLEKRGTTRLLLWEYGLRIFLCILTFALAVSVPQLGLFISLFGALCLSVLGMIFPAIMEICVCYPDNLGPFKIKLYKNIVLILVGIIGLTAGTYSALDGIIKSFMTTDTSSVTTPSSTT